MSPRKVVPSRSKRPERDPGALDGHAAQALVVMKERMDAMPRGLRLPEGNWLEFKRDLSSTDPVLRTLVAFANTAGGRLVIGVSDRSRDVIGVDDPLGLEERLMSVIADRISPRLLPEVEFVSWRTTQLLVIETHLGSNRPYCLLPDGPEQGSTYGLDRPTAGPIQR